MLSQYTYRFLYIRFDFVLYFQKFEEEFYPAAEQTRQFGELLIETVSVKQVQDCVQESIFMVSNTVRGSYLYRPYCDIVIIVT